MKRIIRLTERDLTRIVRRVITEQHFDNYKKNKMIRDIIKFANDNGFIAKRLGGATKYDNHFFKQFTEFKILLSVNSDLSVDLCVGKITSYNENQCDVNNTRYEDKNWNLDTFKSTVKKYMV